MRKLSWPAAKDAKMITTKTIRITNPTMISFRANQLILCPSLRQKLSHFFQEGLVGFPKSSRGVAVNINLADYTAASPY